MNKSRLEWKVGLFVVIGLVILGVLLIQFSKGTSFFKPTYQLRLHAVNVGGLKVRAGVLMSGVQIGTVSDIKLAPDGKSVTMMLRIYSEYEIHKDARFVIEQSGFLGDNYVAILPTENKADVFKNYDEAEADSPFNLQETARAAGGFLLRMDNTVNTLSNTIADVRRFVLNEKTLTNLAATLGSFQLISSNVLTVSEHALTAVDNVNGLVQTNSPSVALAVSNLVFFTEEVDRFSKGLSSMLDTNSIGLNAAIKNIESSTAVLKTLADDLQAGKGPAGTLLKNEQLSADVSQIAYNLNIATSNLNRLGLWGILWKHKPPKTNPPPSHPRTSSAAKSIAN
jgi:phospholipid/cholesterol/gamma-HCH transport system substrate-binding protein